MGADDLEKAADQPTSEDQKSGHSDAADPAGDLREELRGASGATGDEDAPETLKANLKSGTKPSSNIEAEKANLK